MSQMSLKFCELQHFTTSIIIGATTMKQLEENIGSTNIKLSSEIIDKINSVHKNNSNPAP